MGETTCNTIGAWGLITNQAVIKGGGILILLLILYLGYNAKYKRAKLGWILLFVGGASNLYERFSQGCVTDYLKVVSWYPAFNLADILIVAGIILLLAQQLKIKKGK